uniref:ATP synthase complex subunit 8 n=1 Tax=Podagrica fuscicornis TaxID=1425595 RepID=A0A1P8NMP2_9CUCU|nr:ATP synthase F0 subunit 8 [Podagrica fuscicornis]
MPQMMPLNWLLLMIFFIVSFLLFNKTIFFNFFYSKNFSSKTLSLLKKNWKW